MRRYRYLAHHLGEEIQILSFNSSAQTGNKDSNLKQQFKDNVQLQNIFLFKIHKIEQVFFLSLRISLIIYVEYLNSGILEWNTRLVQSIL